MKNRNIVFLVIVLLVLAPMSILYYRSWERGRFKDSEDICLDSNGILFVQRRQLFRAEHEMSHWKGDSRYSTKSSIKAMDSKIGNEKLFSSFYKLNFGLVSVELPRNLSKKSFERLVYYRIWKCGNDYIRYLLYRYAYDFGEKINHLENNCKLSDCRDGDVHTLPPKAVKNTFVSSNREKRAAFTFVRDPLSRFISGYTEVEYRWQQGFPMPPTEYFPIFSNVGSMSRFSEFVFSLLRYLLSENKAIPSFFEYGNPYSDLIHVLPMIGTLVVSRIREKNVSILHLEKFSEDWKHLSDITGLNDLDNLPIRYPRDKFAHNSSSDPFNTTLAAKSLLAFSSDDSYLKFFLDSKFVTTSSNFSSNSSHSLACQDKFYCYKGKRVPLPFVTTNQFQILRQESIQVIRALCRIYIADFQCLNYPLPSICQDIAQEWIDDSSDYFSHQHQLRSSRSSWQFSASMWLFRHLPTYFQRVWAELSCMSSLSAPQCVIEWLYPPEHPFHDPDDEDEDFNHISSVREDL